ncbi:hypothetical protein ABEG17_08350 [Pedococcus sp. KACC 23699]|uniref:Uncharacterized protein n=1 Tax=Pedococcus sp. KACC 23699 TaxID=3149228 RepID=A0AAU7JYK3_9MICO
MSEGHPVDPKRRLVVEWNYYEPVGYVVASRDPGGGAVDLELGDRVMLAGEDDGPDVPAAVADMDGDIARVAVLAGPGVEVLTELGGEDETGLPWAFVDEAPTPDLLVPGALVRAAAGAAKRVWVEVVDRVGSPVGELVHVRRLPVVVTDDSLPLHPCGYAAWTSDPENAYMKDRLMVGTLVVERDMGDPPGTEMPARVSWVEGDPDWFGHLQVRLLPVLTGPNANATVYRLDLSPRVGGRWLVRTKETEHVWDLDAGTYTRLPGPTSSSMAYDGVPVQFTRVQMWPQVGQRSLVFFDDLSHAFVEQWRVSSRIRSITALPREARAV